MMPYVKMSTNLSVNKTSPNWGWRGRPIIPKPELHPKNHHIKKENRLPNFWGSNFPGCKIAMKYLFKRNQLICAMVCSEGHFICLSNTWTTTTTTTNNNNNNHNKSVFRPKHPTPILRCFIFLPTGTNFHQVTWSKANLRGKSETAS